MSYNDQLKDPRWQRKRLAVFTRDDWKCTKCGDESSTLNVHHEYYAQGKKPWEYPDSDLTTLCDSCHKKHHGIKCEDEAADRAMFKDYFLDMASEAYNATSKDGRLLDYRFFTDAVMELFCVQIYYSEHPTERLASKERFKNLVSLIKEKLESL